MITKHIRHYFNQAGLTYFPIWLEKLKQARLDTPGFNDILVGREQDNHGATHLILIFADEQGLKNWDNNHIHIELLAALQPYLQKESVIQLLELESVISANMDKS